MKVDLVGIDLMRIDLVCDTTIYNFKLSTNINLQSLHGRQNKIRQNGRRRNEY